ncbi:hypothetical protein AB0C65_35950 [Nocardia sp. NPDC048505]|uniref:hypothetical protein n=1 Tax=Nocardia sp. NPDC048505 TaxID=3155756 RepID=UPI0033FFA78C
MSPSKDPLVRSGHKIPPGIRPTARDAGVLAWLGEVKIAGTDSMQAAYNHFGGTVLAQQSLSKRLAQLSAAGYLGSAILHRGRNRRVYWPGNDPYRVTRRTMEHDLIAAHLSVQLLQAGGSRRFHHNRAVPAELAKDPRRWTQDLRVDRRSHHADGLLWQPNNTAVIVEVELASKGPARLATILNSHAKRLADPSDAATHLLYLTTRPVGQMVAAAWRKNGHASDHPEAMQVIHALDDLTHATLGQIHTIDIPAA